MIGWQVTRQRLSYNDWIARYSIWKEVEDELDHPLYLLNGVMEPLLWADKVEAFTKMTFNIMIL